jgi:hypothetical protein
MEEVLEGGHTSGQGTLVQGPNLRVQRILEINLNLGYVKVRNNRLEQRFEVILESFQLVYPYHRPNI